MDNPEEISLKRKGAPVRMIALKPRISDLYSQGCWNES
jgi:hypothetical protein